MTRLNLGSGFTGHADWCNYDNSVVARLSRFPSLMKLFVRLGLLPPGILEVKWPPVMAHDCRKGIPHADGSVDFIYTSHMLEHMYRHETIAILKECFRVLKPGAKIRVALPDVKKVADLYRSGQTKVYPNMEEDQAVPMTHADLFSAQFYPHELNRSTPPSFKQNLVELLMRRHKWMYDAESLRNVLKHCGFVDMHEMAYRESSLPEAAALDVHPEISFYLEAEKPKQS